MYNVKMIAHASARTCERSKYNAGFQFAGLLAHFKKGGGRVQTRPPPWILNS